jgi:biotin carboxyl carrier protein
LGTVGGDTEGEISTPMPGIIVRISIEPGDVVAAGQVLLVVEAMKMENEYKCPIDGVVRAVHVAVGQAVEAHTLLVTVEPE